jgi:hypothetical protein
MLLSFNFFVLCIHKTLSVHELHFNRLQMFVQDFKSFLVFFNLQAKLSDQSDLLTDNLVQLFVLVVGIGWEVFV